MAKVRPIPASGQKFAPFRPGPPDYLDPAKLMHERRFVADALSRRGIPRRDIPDVTQDVLVAAWDSVRRGMYRPSRRDDRRRALRRWLYRIAWFTASHYHERSVNIHEEPHEDPWANAMEPATDPEPRQAARAHVGFLLFELPSALFDLLLIDGRDEVNEYAKRAGIAWSTAYKRRAKTLDLLDFDPAEVLWWA